MAAKEIKNAKDAKKFLIDKDLTITDVANSITEHRTVVSRVLNFKRATRHIQKKIEKRFGVRFYQNGRKAA